MHTFTVKKIPVSCDTEKIVVFFDCLLNYFSSAYVSLASILARDPNGHLLASQRLMRTADSFFLNFSRTVMLEYLYSVLNLERRELSPGVYRYSNINRYNMQF